jgi:hypothetical protein
MAGMPGIGDSGSVDNRSLRAVRGLLDWPVHPAWARDSGSAAPSSSSWLTEVCRTLDTVRLLQDRLDRDGLID